MVAPHVQPGERALPGPSIITTSAGASAGPQDAPSSSAAEYPPSTPRPATKSAAARDRTASVGSTEVHT